MKITVLAGNSACTTKRWNLKSGNCLSLFIEFDERKILFDTGQSDLFISNAQVMGIDLSQVHYLVISYGHFDQFGSLRRFLNINKKAKIFLHINAAHKVYNGLFDLIPRYAGCDQKINVQNGRIYFIEEDTQIEEKIVLLEGLPEAVSQPGAQKSLFEQTGSLFVNDKFRHEIVMMLIENDEIVLFSGSLHSWIINTIEEVQLYSKNMRIKAISGGLHIHDFSNNKILTINSGRVFEIGRAHV
jgi:7,8-dihydropterin-6-yl-methyl-4-(beta-D-ribofuranosyl)aminobenzene 5'-phosphate synthase